MSDEQCGADPFENGYDQKLSEKEYRERIKYLMRCHDDSADEIERLRKDIYKQHLDIVTLKQEVRRLREALKLADGALSGANMNMRVVERKVRAALAEQEKK